MIELARHIAFLLLENDCVIVPGLGGFVAYYTPATRVPEEHLFLPPSRVVGFNSRLKMNDGMLVQSYMEVYGTGFADAAKMVEMSTRRLLATLHEEGKADLPDIGELHCTIDDTLDFTPYDNKLATPYLYGLDSFEMKELAAAGKGLPVQTKTSLPVQAKETAARKPVKTVPMETVRKERHTPRLPLKRAYLTNAAAMVAAIALFFLISVPIANTDIPRETSHARLMSGLLPEGLDSRSLLVTPLPLQADRSASASQQDKTTQNGKTASKSVTPKVVKEVKVSTQPTVLGKTATTQADKAASGTATTNTSAAATNTAATATGTAANPAGGTNGTAVKEAAAPAYHIIVASLGKEEDARAMAAQLVTQGYTDAKAIIGDGRMRVCLQSFTTQSEAYRVLSQVRQNEAFENAWVLKK
ncbi:MAG: SPOR domain-containing protein [Prevotellaceae bacterium]|nr:SPOR domain-containing protein [Prevotellaceae bacterium]